MKMKKLLILFLFFGFSNLALSQYALKNVFRSYMNDDDVMAWSMSGDLAQYFTPKDSTYSILSKVDDLDILFFSRSNDITQKEQERIHSAISKDGYEPLIKMKNGDGTVQLFGLENDTYISHLYGRFNFKDKIGYILFKGTIYYEDLQHLNVSNITSNFNIDFD